MLVRDNNVNMILTMVIVALVALMASVLILHLYRSSRSPEAAGAAVSGSDAITSLSRGHHLKPY